MSATSEGAAPGCHLERAEISRQGETVVVLQLVAAACSRGKRQPAPGNGRHGAYVTMSDVPGPLEVSSVKSSLGPAKIFEQEYFECTNSCKRWHEAVALVSLKDPADPAYPTVMAYSPHGLLTRTELQRYVVALHPA